MANILSQGAEATLTQVIFDGKVALCKKRAPKSYRDSRLDTLLRKQRTKSEAKLLYEASQIVAVPHVLAVDLANAEIVMERIDGVPLKKVLSPKNIALCVIAGKHIRKLHDAGIIHGDLTTSNILVQEKKAAKEKKKTSALVFIDFGLGFFSKKVEDKAVDLVVFKKTFNATHSNIKSGWKAVMKGYAPTEELEHRMELIERRGRYNS